MKTGHMKKSVVFWMYDRNDANLLIVGLMVTSVLMHLRWKCKKLRRSTSLWVWGCEVKLKGVLSRPICLASLPKTKLSFDDVFILEFDDVMTF